MPRPNTIGDKNVTTLSMEVHKSCLTNGDDVIGGWTTASLRQSRLLNGAPPSGHQASEKTGGAWVQVSRLGMPLVNEVVIGLKDKDKFNASKPAGDGQFIDYVTNPTLPALLEIALALPNTAPTNFPRNDLVTTFLTGIKGVNQPKAVTASEMLRLNTAIAPVPFEQQNRLGIVGNILAGGSDNAGYPNGPPAQGRRGRHLAGGGDGRPVHGQWRHRQAGLRRGVQAVGRAAGGHRLQAARRGGSGQGARCCRDSRT